MSQDISPWQIVDIGNAPDDVKAYVLGTNDYTYKIATDTSGSIGEHPTNSDTFARSSAATTGYITEAVCRTANKWELL